MVAHNIAVARATAHTTWARTGPVRGLALTPATADRGTAGKAKAGPANWTRRTPRQAAKDNVRA